ncbi:hypothetical protein PROPHIGD79-1_64 [Mycobacterium phage prophi79-1]|nr:hypothetical protein PROPHIGD79-1_64 [Mycobacterium phage prophi79-1]
MNPAEKGLNPMTVIRSRTWRLFGIEITASWAVGR